MIKKAFASALATILFAGALLTSTPACDCTGVCCQAVCIDDCDDESEGGEKLFDCGRDPIAFCESYCAASPTAE